MAELNRQVLAEQVEAAGRRILALDRKRDRGYQHELELEDVVLVVVARDKHGRRWVIDPAELVDQHPDVFAREYVTVGLRRGMGLLEFLDRFAPFAAALAPQASGLFSTLKALFAPRGRKDDDQR